MKKLSFLIALALFLVTATAAFAQSQQLPAIINEVQIDGTTLTPNALNLLSIERGSDYEVRVRFTPYFDIKNAEVRVSIDGYEFSDVNSVDDRTPVFDAKANVTYVKKLTVQIPNDVERASYKLRVTIADRFSTQLNSDYNLQIDVPRNALSIDDVIFNPSDAVRAGSSLLATVRVENKGEKDQQDVRVTVNIPGLGITGTQYIEQIKNDDSEEETEEIFMRVPKCAKPGTYDASIEVEYMKRHRKITAQKTLTVLADDTCSDELKPQTTITLGSQSQNVIGGQTAVFPITVTNAGRTSKTFTIAVPSAEWATISVSPTSTLVVPAGQTQTVFLNSVVNSDAPAGAHSLIAQISSGKENQQITLTTIVAEQQSSMSDVFEIVLVVLVVLLVILAIVIGIVHFRTKDQTETYY